jgi:hypothetical protein
VNGYDDDDEYNFEDLSIGFAFFIATYCLLPNFHKATFCGVPSRASVKDGCVMSKERLRAEHWPTQQCCVYTMSLLRAIHRT